MAEKFIIELNKVQIEFVAAMVHHYLSLQPESEVAQQALEELIQQTNCVYRDAEKHGIMSTRLVSISRTSATKWGENVSGILGDLTDMSGMMMYGEGD